MDNKLEKQLEMRDKINTLKKRLTEIYATELLEYYENKKYDKTNLERLQQAMELVSEIDEGLKTNTVENDFHEQIKSDDIKYFSKSLSPSKYNYDKFKDEIETIINKNSMENATDTPDFILAQYLTDCLKTFDKTVKRRDEWCE